MDRRLFSFFLAAFVVLTVVFYIGGQTTSPSDAPQEEEKVATKDTEKKTASPAKTPATTPTESATPETEVTPPVATPSWSLKPFLMKHRPELMHPAKSDSIAIGANGPDQQVDLAGWKVRSTMSGKTFTIPTVLNPSETGSHAPLKIGSLDVVVFVHTVGSAADNYRSGNEFHLYYGEQTIAWKEHDTIQLVSPKGEVVDTYSY